MLSSELRQDVRAERAPAGAGGFVRTEEPLGGWIAAPRAEGGCDVCMVMDLARHARTRGRWRRRRKESPLKP